MATIKILDLNHPESIIERLAIIEQGFFVEKSPSYPAIFAAFFIREVFFFQKKKTYTTQLLLAHSKTP
jgi:hypothetical protein